MTEVLRAPTVRFTRQDELSLLARAVQRCYSDRHPDRPDYDTARLREEVAAMHVWWPGCLVAETEDGEPVGVLLVARRGKHALVHRFSVHRTFEGQGLEERLLKALCDKLTAEGVTQLFAEVPEDGPTALFEKKGFEPLMRLMDLDQTRMPPPLAAPGVVQEFAVEELLAFPGLWSTEVFAWRRAYKTLHARRSQLTGLGLFTKERLVAAVIYESRPVKGRRILCRFGRLSGDHGLAALSLLLRVLGGRVEEPLFIAKMHAGEVPMDLVTGWGFTPVRTYMRYRMHLGSHA